MFGNKRPGCKVDKENDKTEAEQEFMTECKGKYLGITLGINPLI